MTIRVILAGGGTAGHIEPALAVATELKKINPEIQCEFLGTITGLENALVPGRGFPLRVIPKVAMPRELSLSILFWPFRLAGSIGKCLRIMRGAQVVIGFGGYVSASAYLAAVILRIPIVIHEANAKPGWANRLGRFFAKKVCVNFQSVQSKWTDSIHTGMPLRRDIAEISRLSAEQIQEIRERKAREWGFDSKKPIVSVFGGSTGSERINDAIAEYLIASNGSSPQIAHAVGLHNTLPINRTGYFATHYFHDIADVYIASDLLICRSGAVTCAELAVVNRYAVLIPLPIGNGEQEANADELMARDSATMVRNSIFSSSWLLQNMTTMLDKALKFRGVTRDVVVLPTAQTIAEMSLAIAQAESQQ